jgi:hypothetical protein
MGTVIQFQAMVRCAHCGGEAKLLMVPGEMTPWWRKFPSFVRGMVMPIGLITLGLLALYCALLSMIPYAGPALASALLAVYCVWVVRDAARGRAHLPLVNSVTEFLDLLADLFFVAIRFTMATALLWTPLVVRLAMLEEPERVLLEPSLLWLDPLFCAVVALAALYVPAALVICTITDSLIGPLNPVYSIRRVLRVPGQYAATAGVVATLLAIDVVVGQAFARGVGYDTIGLLTRFLHHLIGLPLPLLAAFVLGRFVCQNGDVFGVVPAGEFLVPAAPGVEPSGSIDDQ